MRNEERGAWEKGMARLEKEDYAGSRKEEVSKKSIGRERTASRGISHRHSGHVTCGFAAWQGRALDEDLDESLWGKRREAERVKGWRVVIGAAVARGWSVFSGRTTEAWEETRHGRPWQGRAGRRGRHATRVDLQGELTHAWK